MKNTFVILALAISVLIIGFIVPPIIVSPKKLGRELGRIYQHSIRTFGRLFVTGRILNNDNNQYKNHCDIKSQQILVQTYTWMMIPGPIVEVCISSGQLEEFFDWNYLEIYKL